MNLIFITRKGSRTIRLGTWWRYGIPLLAILALGGAFGTGGYFLGLAVGPGEHILAMEDELVAQRIEVETARARAQGEVEALTARLGMLQAQVLRLEAVGERLVRVAGLDDGEFDFETTPGLGGPADPATAVSASAVDLIGDLDRLAQTLMDREEQLRILERLMQSQQVEKTVTPSGGPIETGYISSRYGTRNDPFTGRREFHQGLDFVAAEGADVFALGGGIVIWSGRNQGYGKMVEIDHGNGYATRYAHNSRLLVSVGDMVRKGQVIAKLGSTGRSTGPHVHLEVLKDGRHVNPLQYIQAAR